MHCPTSFNVHKHFAYVIISIISKPERQVWVLGRFGGDTLFRLDSPPLQSLSSSSAFNTQRHTQLRVIYQLIHFIIPIYFRLMLIETVFRSVEQQQHHTLSRLDSETRNQDSRQKPITPPIQHSITIAIIFALNWLEIPIIQWEHLHSILHIRFFMRHTFYNTPFHHSRGLELSIGSNRRQT